MHEYPLTLNIIEIAAGYVRGENARVSKIRLVVGEASGVSGDCIRLYFDEIAQGTVCEGAKIEITGVKPLLKCEVCGKYFRRKPFSFACDKPNCTGEGIPTDIGREFYVKNIETIED